MDTRSLSPNTFSPELVDAERQRLTPLALKMETAFPDGIAIYGAGFLGTWAADYLRSIGARVTRFIDRDPRKIGTEVAGVPVYGPVPESLAEIPALFIAARHAVAEVARDMAPFGMPTMSFDGYFVLRNYQRLTTVRDGYLIDDRSKQVFNALLMAMLTASVSPCKRVMEKDMYFCLPEFSGNFDETFVDAGAFVGDTVERFIWENLGTFRHIYAFEPGDRQFKALQQRMVRLAAEWAIDPASVSLVRAGLSDQPGQMGCTFLNDAPLRHGSSALLPPGSESDDDPQSARVVTLDDYLAGRPISFLKADVEGMEMELLRGAQQTIRTCRPKMALCVYHYPSHLYEVAEYVRELVTQYQFSLRQHVPLFGDFVLYCWVDAP